MFLEIHNALATLLRSTMYRQVTINPRNGLAVNGDLVAPQAIAVRPSMSGFGISANRRDLLVERNKAEWVAMVDVPGLVDFTEAEDVLSSPIHVPLEGHRGLIVVLTAASYGTPPDQSPSSGSSATFNFAVFAPTLRN